MLPAADSRDGNPRVYSATLEDWEAPTERHWLVARGRAPCIERMMRARRAGQSRHSTALVRASRPMSTVSVCGRGHDKRSKKTSQQPSRAKSTKQCVVTRTCGTRMPCEVDDDA
jgi:hypothetical protein